MKQKRTLLILILVFVLVLGGAYTLYDRLGQQVAAQQLTTQPAQDRAEQQTEQTEPAQAAAPDFTVYDIDGNPVMLSDFTGKPVVLNFWASWCGPCQTEMPDFQAKYTELGAKIHFLMVNMTDGSRETVASAAEFIRQSGFTFPVYFDTELEAAIAYGASSLPTTYFIDAEGRAIARAVGAIDADTLQRGIDMVLPSEAQTGTE